MFLSRHLQERNGWNVLDAWMELAEVVAIIPVVDPVDIHVHAARYLKATYRTLFEIREVTKSRTCPNSLNTG